MINSGEDDLGRLYARAERGMSVQEFLQSHSAIFTFIEAANLIEDYRLAKSRLKRLRDELTPAARFFRLHAANHDQVQFPLDSSVPDCNWRPVTGGHIKIEITVLQARERLNLMTELNETGEGRGFIGINDDQPTADFTDAMKQERRMYSTDEAKEKLTKAVSLCVNNKLHSRGDLLLIDSPLDWLQSIRWMEIVPQLQELVRPLSYSGIYLVGEQHGGDLCLQIR